MGSVAGALVKAGKLPEARALVEDLRAKKDSFSIGTVLRRYGRSLSEIGSVESAMAIANELDKSQKAEMLQPLVEQLSNSGKLDEAISTLEKIPYSEYPDYRARAVGFLAGKLAKANRPEEAVKLVQAHRQISGRNDKDWASTVIYEIAPYAAWAGASTLTVTILQQAPEPKDQPPFFRATHLTYVANALAIAGLDAEGAKALDEARKIAAQIPRDEVGDKQKPQYVEGQAMLARVMAQLHRYREAQNMADSLVSTISAKQDDILLPRYRAWARAWQLYTYSIILLENAKQTNPQLAGQLRPDYWWFPDVP
ncbi:MAG: hypothetical protein NTW28_32295 [Candidatus Solibacter sp.]|nr:hypothetical protein [Candidatus Solibacter sp.]